MSSLYVKMVAKIKNREQFNKTLALFLRSVKLKKKGERQMTEYIFSPSQMGMFFGCAAAYYQRYIMGLKVPPRIALLLGSGVDKGAETNFRQKIETHEDLPLGDVQDATATAFDERLDADGVYLMKEEKPMTDSLLSEAKDKAVQMVGVFHRQAAPAIQPISVQTEVSFFREELEDVVFRGFPDIIDENENVLDVKTSKNKWSEGKAENEFQPTFYLPGARASGMKASKFTYHIVTKAKTPVYQVVDTERDESDLLALEERARTMVACIKAGLFPPVEPDHWRCSSPKWCGYYVNCKYKSERDKNRYFSIPIQKSE